ncbi:MAG: hypothetical protein ABW321_23770 [Polyangiales bacterium]
MPTRNSVCLALVLAACAPKAQPRHHIAVLVESEPGVGLPGAQLRANGATLATTGDDGRMRTELVGEPGEVVRLDVSCPEGHRTPLEPITVLLRPLAERGKHPEYHVMCPPLLRTLVVAVRATHGAQLPLRHLGQTLARTDASGAAHALLRAAPGDTLTLSLDTSAPEHATLMPQNPELKISVPDHDELVVFDQTFVLPKVKTRPKKPPPPPAPVGPQRI